MNDCTRAKPINPSSICCSMDSNAWSVAVRLSRSMCLSFFYFKRRHSLNYNICFLILFKIASKHVLDNYYKTPEKGVYNYTAATFSPLKY